MLLESLFYIGYEYQEILYMLTITITISLSPLKRKLKQCKLHRNKVEFDPKVLKCHYDENVFFSFPLFLTKMYVIGLDKCELL